MILTTKILSGMDLKKLELELNEFLSLLDPNGIEPKIAFSMALTVDHVQKLIVQTNIITITYAKEH